MTGNKKTILMIAVPIAVILGALFFLFPQLFHGLTRFFHDLIIPILLLAGIAITGVFIISKGRTDRRFYTEYDTKFSWIGGSLLVIGVLVFVAAIIGGNYFAGKSLYQGSQVKATSAEDLSFDTRAPFDVATATSNRTLGDTNGDSTGDVKANPANETFSVSIKKRGIGKGYESVQSMNIPQFGSPKSGDVTFCEYSDDANLRLGGMLPSNSMSRALAFKTGLNVGWDSSDAIAVCIDENHPVLYIPLKKSTGFLGVHDMPAGVAIYDGKTGELTVEKDVKSTAGDTPIYAQSLARDQRVSANTSTGFADWLFRRTGFETTDKGDDPNSGNATEFAMQKEDGSVVYVTPVTPRGSSSSIVGLTTVDSTSVTYGELNPLVVNRYESSRKATSTVAANIIGDTLSGYKASGLTVFEVAPGPDGTWVASIGRDQSILYRASIDADGNITLIDGDDAKPSDDDKVKAKADKPLEDMSNEELKDLGDQILEELANRSDG